MSEGAPATTLLALLPVLMSTGREADYGANGDSVIWRDVNRIDDYVCRSGVVLFSERNEFQNENYVNFLAEAQWCNGKRKVKQNV